MKAFLLSLAFLGLLDSGWAADSVPDDPDSVVGKVMGKTIAEIEKCCRDENLAYCGYEGCVCFLIIKAGDFQEVLKDHGGYGGFCLEKRERWEELLRRKDKRKGIERKPED